MAEPQAYIRGVITKLETILTRDRREAHGDAMYCMKAIAKYWSLYLDKELTEENICVMMSLLKIARTTTGNKDNRDHLIDSAGYGILAVALKDRKGYE